MPCIGWLRLSDKLRDKILVASQGFRDASKRQNWKESVVAWDDELHFQVLVPIKLIDVHEHRFVLPCDTSAGDVALVVMPCDPRFHLPLELLPSLPMTDPIGGLLPPGKCLHCLMNLCCRFPLALEHAVHL